MLLDPSNATTPVGWYSEPSYRGTYSLLSSCVSTLLICVLSAVHLDVPAEHHSRLHKWAKKAKWVAVGVFAPEWLTMTAYLEWQNARGLVLEANSRRRHHWDLIHGFYASTGGFCLQTSQGTLATLTAQGVSYLIDKDPDSIPDISSKEVRDKSKHDSLAKCLALIQVLWFSAECLTRLAQNLPVSLLELNTFVHTLFALITYTLWWKKPFNVDVPTTLPMPRNSDVLATLLAGQDPSRVSSKYLQKEGTSKPFLVRLKWYHLFRGTADPFHLGQSDPIQCRLRVMISSFFGALYGALHISAWYYPFPTQVECVIWRVSVSCIVVCGLIVSLSQALAILHRGHNTKDSTWMSRLVAIKLVVVNFAAAYSILISCFARFFIVMESFRSVWFLPAAAYVLPEWSRYMPHFD
ncbi:uncharacterized protein STEHIDRAFT_68897 [Stereum hirsutum FP-91666 SS1]|uniref:Transmembrane protein n=1 Tax=Stereum hirsutum (strain FP-91666) TaxID=721885 RepID=R7RYY9_STEHR|nr:uncharacterized protein STEHIDRAFT_68897 [Stereum hirsutum FP-91666 SS1]EIM80033.1 hypothetical protein STEHIDRAFT_68897 [Stereum hirsutum FP-91666 SS1]